MKLTRVAIPLLTINILLFAILACNVPGQPVADSPPVVLEETVHALETLAAAQNPVGTPAQPESGASAQTPASPDVLPTATVVHLLRPGEPGPANTFVTDASTKSQAAARTTYSEIFDQNLLERPYSSQVMDYQAHLDLTRVNLHITAPWVYVTFVLEGPPPPDSTATYAIEFDLDSDGRGDWLILGRVPNGSEWTSDGAQVYTDSNNDVGGFTPMESDSPNPAWNGYDQLVYDQGIGNDPDAAWVRRNPTNPNQVQLAFKYALIANDDEFAFGGYADEGLRNPAGLDYNDFKTLDQAGSPISGNSKYPIKELALVDNTCRWTYGYPPLEPIPGLCPLPATPTPTATATATATDVPQEEPGCQPPPQGCTNGWWVGEPDCHCTIY